jgi:2-polyprenyl-3-methyl-5-hydroxy-6-metoxy-1,4-benzoquinol methylase
MQIIGWAYELKARSILDYGCGAGALKPELRRLGWRGQVHEYDPAVPGKEARPPACDVVACTDVLEHVEADKLNAVLRDIEILSSRGAYLAIATRAANTHLPDGRNAHLIVEPPAWWSTKLWFGGWVINHEKAIEGREVCFWLLPPNFPEAA